MASVKAIRLNFPKGSLVTFQSFENSIKEFCLRHEVSIVQVEVQSTENLLSLEELVDSINNETLPGPDKDRS